MMISQYLGVSFWPMPVMKYLSFVKPLWCYTKSEIYHIKVIILNIYLLVWYNIVVDITPYQDKRFPFNFFTIGTTFKLPVIYSSNCTVFFYCLLLSLSTGKSGLWWFQSANKELAPCCNISGNFMISQYVWSMFLFLLYIILHHL